MIRKIVSEVSASWPDSLRSDFLSYFSRFSRRGKNSTGGPRAAQPTYWLEFPRWLHARFMDHRDGPRLPKSAIEEVIRAQVCLFLFLRIEDDLIDLEEQRGMLIIAGNQFLWAAEEYFSRCVGTDKTFWQRYRSLLRETTLAAIEVDYLQRNMRTNGGELRRLYASVGAALSIAAAAVCGMNDHARLFPTCRRFYDHMTVAGQIMDDLQDMTADLDAGRMNYAARRMLEGRGDGGGPVAPNKQLIAEQFVRTNAVHGLLEECRSDLRAALAILKRLRLVEGMDLVTAQLTALGIYDDSFHRQRVNILFQGVVTP